MCLKYAKNGVSNINQDLRMDLILFGEGGTVQFSRTGKLNINISPQKCWREGWGWGEVIKNFPDTPKTFLQTYENFAGYIKPNNT
jgi:hypothetical protein